MDFLEKGCLSHFLLYSETAINQIRQGRYVHYCAIGDCRPRRTDTRQLMVKTIGRWVSYLQKSKGCSLILFFCCNKLQNMVYTLYETLIWMNDPPFIDVKKRGVRYDCRYLRTLFH